MSEILKGLGAEDRAMLANSIARFASKHYLFEDRGKRLAEANGRRATWPAIAEMGLLALLVPDAQGGLGGSIADAGVVMETIGRHLIVDPYLSTGVIAASLLAELEGAAADLEAVVSGTCIVALAVQEPELGYARGPVATRAVSAGNGWALTGAKSAVLDAPIADLLLVTARDPAGMLGLFAVEAPAAAPGLVSHETVDGRTIGEVRFVGVVARRIGNGDATEAVSRALARATIAICFEATGSMEVLVDATADHIRTRRAFGGTLSQFQVLRHRLVDMLIAAQEVRALTEATAATYAADPYASEAAVSAMKVHLCRAARTVAEGAVQLHGGMGMTDELMVSHHFKRLMMIEALFGDAEHHLERYIELTVAGAAA
jgi:alkylation response protein AidB-like acyl-CoA dehydrogenase